MTHSLDPVSGEQQHQRRERRTWAIKGSLFAVGLIAGVLVGYLLGERGLLAGANWPPEIALALAALYLAAVGIGSLLLRELHDEVEKQLQYKAMALAGIVFLLAYPVWFLLWKGGFVMEPVHWVLFAGFYLALLGAFLFYRYR